MARANRGLLQAEGRKIRYVPMTPELAAELRKYPAVIGEENLFPRNGIRRASARVEPASEPSLPRGIENFRFMIQVHVRIVVHDVAGTCTSWQDLGREHSDD
jgi:integrase